MLTKQADERNVQLKKGHDRLVAEKSVVEAQNRRMQQQLDKTITDTDVPSSSAAVVSYRVSCKQKKSILKHNLCFTCSTPTTKTA